MVASAGGWAARELVCPPYPQLGQPLNLVVGERKRYLLGSVRWCSLSEANLSEAFPVTIWAKVYVEGRALVSLFVLRSLFCQTNAVEGARAVCDTPRDIDSSVARPWRPLRR